MVLDWYAVQIALDHTLLSIYVWLCGAWRPGMAAASATFHYAQRYKDQVHVLWSSVCAELKLMRSYLPFVSLDLAASLVIYHCYAVLYIVYWSRL